MKEDVSFAGPEDGLVKVQIIQWCIYYCCLQSQ